MNSTIKNILTFIVFCLFLNANTYFVTAYGLYVSDAELCQEQLPDNGSLNTEEELPGYFKGTVYPSFQCLGSSVSENSLPGFLEFLQAGPGVPEDDAESGMKRGGDFHLPAVKGSITVIPSDNWSSGNFDQLMSVINPISAGELEKYLYIEMDSTATTMYEGDLWFRESGISMGMRLDTDDNFIGKFNKILGYLSYKNYSIRLQRSRLKGELSWKSDYTVPEMPLNYLFDNSLTTIDLLFYPKSNLSDFYFGAGYTSYELPVQLDCIVVNEAGDIIYGNHVYQPDMKFRIYSLLFGFDTLNSAFMETDSIFNTGDGFGFWAATQDRFGMGFSYISSQAEAWVESANPGRQLYDDKQFTMMVDYNLVLGIRWTGNRDKARIGAGLGYSLGGHIIMALSHSFKPISEVDQVEASPNLYLFHHGLIMKLTASW